jgi:hypothetical protein
VEPQVIIERRNIGLLAVHGNILWMLATQENAPAFPDKLGRLALAPAWRLIRVDLESCETKSITDRPDAIWGLHADDEGLVVAGRERIQLRDQEGTLLHDHEAMLQPGLGLTASRRYVAFGTVDNTASYLTLLDRASGQMLRVAKLGSRANAVAASDTQIAWAESDQMAVHVADVDTPVEFTVVDLPDGVDRLTFSGKRFVATGLLGGLMIIEGDRADVYYRRPHTRIEIPWVATKPWFARTPGYLELRDRSRRSIPSAIVRLAPPEMEVVWSAPEGPQPSLTRKSPICSIVADAEHLFFTCRARKGMDRVLMLPAHRS